MVQNAGQGIAFRLEVVRKRGSCARTWGHGFSRFRRDGQRSRLRGGIRPPSGRFVKAVDGYRVAPRYRKQRQPRQAEGIMDGIAQGLAFAESLHRGQAVVQVVRDGAVAVQRECAV